MTDGPRQPVDHRFCVFMGMGMTVLDNRSIFQYMYMLSHLFPPIHTFPDQISENVYR